MIEALAIAAYATVMTWFLVAMVNMLSLLVRGTWLFFPNFSTGRSMEPTIPGGVTMVLEVVPKNLEKGDIVVYRGDRGFIQHRIIEEGDGEFLIQGDNNPIPDGWVEEKRIIAKTVTIAGEVPYLPVSPRSIAKTIAKILK